MAGPLNGMRVVEMAGLGPGPFAAMLLADLGADVIRVDRPGPVSKDAERYVLHRGRRSIAVDAKHTAGVEIVLALVERADILIEGHRPGVMERLGLGPDPCLARNPRLVYARMTGWGQDGPLARTAGHDIDYIALSGALGVTARRGERPVPPVNMLGDFGGGGAFLVIGALAAVWEASSSGQGQVIDAAMVDGSASLTAMLHGMLAQGRWHDEPGTNFADTGSPSYEVYRCSDGRDIAVGAIEGPFYQELLAGLGLAGLGLVGGADAGAGADTGADAGAGLPDRRDPASWPTLKERFAAVFATRSRDEWEAVFAGTDACVAPVLSLREAPGHPHNVARGTFPRHHGITQPGPAPRFSRTPAELDRPPPRPGQHTDEILAELGHDPRAIDALRTAAAVA